MKAIQVHQFGDPTVLKLEDVPAPTPGPNQILIRTKAIGVNPVDTYIRSGIYGPRTFPYTPGSDAAGVVGSVGPGVTAFKPGDRVYTSKTVSGAYAELILADEPGVHPLPAHASFAQGAAIGAPAGAAWRALFHRGHAQPGEYLLVHGATGAVGTAAVQLARAAGLVVFGTAGSPAGEKLVLDQGAHAAFPHTITDDPAKVKSITNGRGFDLILENLANVNLAADLPCLAKRGRVLVVGNRGTITINPRDTMAPETDIRGVSLINATPDEWRAMHAALVAALEANTLRPVIDHDLPLSAAPQAHEEVMQNDSRGKIVLVP